MQLELGDDAELGEPFELPPDRNARRVYLARLAAGSRPTMAEALESRTELYDASRVSKPFTNAVAIVLSVAAAAAALIFTVVLLGFIVFKRKDIKSGFRLNIKDIKRITGIGVKENENNYEIFLDTTGMNIQKPFGIEPNRIYLKIPPFTRPNFRNRSSK